MGTHLSLARPPLELAVDVLSQRVGRGELREYLDYGPPTSPKGESWKQTWSGYVQASSIELSLLRAYAPLQDVFAGVPHDYNEPWEWEWDRERTDPNRWIVFGARKAGWKAPDFPLRYSLPSDVLHIRAALGNLSEDVVEARIAAVVAGRPGEDADALRRMMAEWLPQLRRFYDAAAESGEIVLYLLG